MWCHHCRQDVPGIAAAVARSEPPQTADADNAAIPHLEEGAATGESQIYCARCGGVISQKTSHETAESASAWKLANETATSTSESQSSSASVEVEFQAWQWELDQELHDVRRLLESRQATMAEDETPWHEIDFNAVTSNAAPRLDSPHPSGLASSVAYAPSEKKRREPILAWLVLSLSVMAFACGGALLGWAMLGDRGDLWNLGLPITLGGQAGLVLGLVMLFERIWRDSRQTSDRMQHVDHRLNDLQHSAATREHSSYTSRSFRRHSAAENSPHLLLGDLHDQLDRLGRQITDR